MKENSPIVDVVVIGAGPAGIGAASILKQKGLNVQILEARERIGGRAFTVHDYGLPLDLGAQWFHYHEENNPMFTWA